MLFGQRQQCFKEIKWNHAWSNDLPNYAVSVLECWKSPNIEDAVQGRNYRQMDLCRERSLKEHQTVDVDDRIDRWLRWQDTFRPLLPLEGVGASFGGIRLIICERAGPFPGMAMSSDTFLNIERAFHLHPATLPSFCAHNGTYALFIDQDTESSASTRNIRMVVRLPQKIEIGNSTMSLSYDASTGWTNALICGEGLLTASKHDQTYGNKLTQITNAILAEPEAWDNPLLLPYVLLQTYIYRLQLRSDYINDTLTELETQIGVTFAGRAGYRHERDRWPQDVDPKSTTIALHSISTQIIFVCTCCQWVKEYASYLLTIVSKIKEAIPQQYQHRIDHQESSQSIEYLLHTTSGIHNRYMGFKHRASIQTNALFNIISQQASILNQRDMQLSFRIAKSGKQDSISMTTFTFLTAVFLPGTFIAAIFSMGMFDWQNQDVTNNNNISSTTQSSYVTKNFWIFWAVTLPLTLVTMTSWYLWSQFANKKWLNELNHATAQTQDGPHSAQNELDLDKLCQFNLSKGSALLSR